MSGQLNYHHLRYFREVARDGNLTRTAQRLNLSQSALSTQIKTLEARLGHDLFERAGRALTLTEVGRIALDHADRIFGVGDELIATLATAQRRDTPLRIGALSTLSRNFQIRFLEPLLTAGRAQVILRSGDAPQLFEALRALSLDVVLTTEPPRDAPDLVAHALDAQSVALHAHPARLTHATLRDLLTREPLILPSEPSIRMGFDNLIARLGIRPHIMAEVDDMAMVRLLARADAGVALAPAVVLADEIAQGLIATAPYDLDLTERFYAVTAPRSFPHAALATLLPG